MRERLIITACFFDAYTPYKSEVKNTVNPLYNVKFGSHFFLLYIGFYVNSIKSYNLFIRYT